MDFLKDSTGALYRKFLFASVCSALVMSVYSFVDTIAVGQSEGTLGALNVFLDWAAKRGIFIESYYHFGGLNRCLQYRLLNLNIIFKSGSLYKKYVFISPLPFTSMSMEFP